MVFGIKRMIPETELSYMAGIIDGEGCIGIYYSKRGKYEARLQVSNTSKCLVDWIIQRFAKPYIGVHKMAGQKDVFVLSWIGKTAAGLIKEVAPFLQIKRAQADLLLEFVDTILVRGKRLSPELKALRDDMCLRSHELNRRGVSNACVS